MLVNKIAPDFNAQGVNKKNKIIKINFWEKINNKNTVLFFWPLDFTFVCPSEILAFNNRYKEFSKRKVKLIGVSIDSVYTHIAWKNTPISNGGIGKLNFDIISDIKRKIQKIYKVEHKDTGTSLRATFIIDKNKIIRHQSINDLPLGRNIDEIIRLIDAINFNATSKKVCQAQWISGDEGITPNYKGICKFLKNNYKKI